MLFRSLSLACLGGVVFSAACNVEDSAEHIGDEETVAFEQPIKGGYEDSTDTSVVGIAILTGPYFGTCSGSLLAPNMVLTARHCVSEISTGEQVICSQTNASAAHGPDSFYVTTKQSMGQNPNDYYTVREVGLLPDSMLCGNDAAILFLTENIPESEAKPLIPRVDSPLTKNEQYYAVGYGATNDSGAGSGERRRRDNLFVECAETECTGVGQFVKQTEWIGDTGICGGDSGGPALDLQNRVVGITSRGAQGCDSPVYGSVHSHAEWIKNNAIYASQLGGYPPPPWATGAPTDPSFTAPVGGLCDATCTTGLCVNDKCTRSCNAQAPCPEGWECVDAGGQSICSEIPPPPVEEEETTTSTTGGGGGSKKKKGTTRTVTSCAISTSSGEDPTNPVPWIVSLGAVVAVGVRRRKRDAR